MTCYGDDLSVISFSYVVYSLLVGDHMSPFRHVSMEFGGH